MPHAEWTAVRALFESLVDQPPQARATALAAAPTALRDEAQALLAQHDAEEAAGGAFLSRPAQLPAEAGAPTDRLGQRLGPWRLTGLLGRGGMGDVWLAARDDGAYDGEVAVKVLRPGFGHASVLARFADEQRALARLVHPNIARLLDAGRTADGQPYFVMERVRGQPLDVAAAGRPLAERLRLLLQLADAVSFAHRQLLVHRDLKPANVLVDESGQIKLLDFGIAKALDPLEGADAAHTLAGERPLTPHCASPEQVRGEPVGTATDVYSLGVLLYGLLTGRRPCGEGLTDARAVLQAVLNETPRRPSAVLPPGDALARTLRGDLDRIVMKALAKLPAERYGSVDALAADLRAWQQGRPVSASQPRPGYLLRRFVARHRVGVAAGTLALAALLGALGALLHQVHETEAARAVAERRFAQARQLAQRMVFDHHQAIVNLAGALPAREALLADAQRYLQTLAADVGNDAVLARELAETHYRIAVLQGETFSASLERLDAAEANLDQALRLQPLYLGRPGAPADALSAGVDMWLSRSQMHTRRGRLRPALAALESARPLVERLLREEGERVDIVSRQATLEGRIGLVQGGSAALAHLGRLDVAGEHFRRSTALMESLVRREPANPEWRHQLAWALSNQQAWALLLRRLPESRALAERTLVLRREAAAGRPDDAHLRYQGVISELRLGSVLAYEGQAEAGLRLLDGARATTQRLAEADPGNRQLVRDLAIADVVRGRAAALTGDGVAAARILQAALRALPAATPGDMLVTYWHVEARLWLARSRGAADAAAALDDADAALALAQALPEDPDNAARRWMLAQAHEARASAGRALGRAELAASAEAAALAAWGGPPPPLFAPTSPRGP
ncbi:MAG: protein kinase [Rubrivivax sp.]|nr:protein kinase [Rubrivivax sp.]